MEIFNNLSSYFWAAVLGSFVLVGMILYAKMDTKRFRKEMEKFIKETETINNESKEQLIQLYQAHQDTIRALYQEEKLKAIISLGDLIHRELEKIDVTLKVLEEDPSELDYKYVIRQHEHIRDLLLLHVETFMKQQSKENENV